MAHGAALRQQTHAQDDFIVRVARDWQNVGLDDADVAMLDFAAKVTLNAASCTKEDVDGLRSRGFSDGEILEIVLVVCWYSVQTRLADALGVELDEASLRNKALMEAFSFK